MWLYEMYWYEMILGFGRLFLITIINDYEYGNEGEIDDKDADTYGLFAHIYLQHWQWMFFVLFFEVSYISIITLIKLHLKTSWITQLHTYDNMRYEMYCKLLGFKY